MIQLELNNQILNLGCESYISVLLLMIDLLSNFRKILFD